LFFRLRRLGGQFGLERVVAWLAELDAQVFATAVGWPGAFDAWPEARRFHVEHGGLLES
jgi:hypothetical protein